MVGASSLGFITTVLPTASGMAMDRMPRTSGAFHGEIAPTTPKEIRWAIEYYFLLAGTGWAGR